MYCLSLFQIMLSGAATVLVYALVLRWMNKGEAHRKGGRGK